MLNEWQGRFRRISSIDFAVQHGDPRQGIALARPCRATSAFWWIVSFRDRPTAVLACWRSMSGRVRSSSRVW